jgi:phage shock protein A
MFGIGGVIKAIVALLIVGILAGGIWHITNLKANLAIAEENEKKLRQGIEDQQALLEQMKADIEQIQIVNKALQEQNEKQRKDVESLASKFDKRDFGALSAAKPAMAEKLVNRGTVNALRCLELATGAELTDAEKSAKSPTEANRECPSLINSNYTAPAN